MRQLVVVTILGYCATAYAQPTGNVLSRVYQIKFNGESGTAFVLDYEDRQYFVTARHIMQTAAEGAKASVQLQGLNEPMKERSVIVLLGKNKCVDVAVLVPTEKNIITAEAIPYPYKFAFGQEAYFLGFPYGLFTSTNQGGAAALIKHAYISAVVSCKSVYSDGDTDQDFILLDGFNNPGFSGGPIVAPDMFSPFTNIRLQKLVGVVAGFVKAESQNTGIVFATPIEKGPATMRN